MSIENFFLALSQTKSRKFLDLVWERAFMAIETHNPITEETVKTFQELTDG